MHAFIQVTCSKCGVTFGVASEFRSAIGDRIFWCPNGHKQVFVEDLGSGLKKELEAAKTEIQNLKKRIEAAQAEEAFWKAKCSTPAKTMEAPEPSGGPQCSKCGAGISDADHDDNGGLCDDCCGE